MTKNNITTSIDSSGNETEENVTELQEISLNENENTNALNKYGDYENKKNDSSWFDQVEYVIFKNELKSIKNNYLVVLKECKENKRLLDLKYDDLNKIVNNIQTSVIFFSTISGFLQATRIQFTIPDHIIAIISITISTYISLLLSISKYYKLDEMKEKIQVLREKFSLLHNQLDYQMDVLGPWMEKNIWIYQDPKLKLSEWAKLFANLNEEYESIIETKKELVTEFEIIMDTKSRNYYHIKNRELNFSNRKKLNEWDLKEHELELSIQESSAGRKTLRPSISLKHEELDNWSDTH